VSTFDSNDYLREDKLPHLWCSGCSHGTVVRTIARALAGLQIDPASVVVVTGIGCFGKADDYFATHALHGTHGRALAFATGIKAVKPELTVLALMGDGDSSTIGGNHLIHAARRNIDLTVIVSNNLNYGMTGGQYSATTPAGSITSTSAYGTPEPGFDLCELVKSAGGTFVARCTPYHGLFYEAEMSFCSMLENILIDALKHKGFSFVESLSCCPTYYGRYNRKGDASQMIDNLKDRTLIVKEYEKLPAKEKKNYIPIGKLFVSQQPDFNTQYKAVQQKAAK
jgi:2-oxoglutarate ferredoxin oxidoreductase subunit beta